jgi:hypothetical protein
LFSKEYIETQHTQKLLLKNRFGIFSFFIFAFLFSFWLSSYFSLFSIVSHLLHWHILPWKGKTKIWLLLLLTIRPINVIWHFNNNHLVPGKLCGRKMNIF